MKLSAVIIVGLADAAQEVVWKPLYKAPKFDNQERRVRGQHPQRRLQSVNKFMCRWVRDVFGVDSAKAARVCNRITDTVYRHEATFVNKDCAYYNPDVPKGGPNPDPNAEGNRKNKDGDWVPRRLRRQASISDEETDWDITDEDEEAYDDCDGTETGEMKEFCENDKGKRTVPVVERKLKRYTTLWMKWCDRYISECYGQRVHNICFERAKKFYINLKKQIPE